MAAGGASGAAVATVGMFLPAFAGSAASAALMPRLRTWRAAHSFLQGVNAAAVALVGVVVVMLAREALTGPVPIAIAFVSAVAVLKGINPSVILVGAAAGGALAALF